MLNRSDRNIFAIWYWTIDSWLLVPAIVLLSAGFLLIMGASPPVAMRIGLDNQHFLIRHAVFLIPGITALIGFSLLSHRMIRIVCLAGFLASLALIALSLLGPEVKGATRWIPVGSFKIQPSEFAKPFFAVVTAWLLTLWREKEAFPGWAISMGCLALLALLLVLQPDMGMTAVVLAIWSFQIFLAGMPLAMVLVLAFLVAPVVAATAYFTLPHVQVRVAKFLEGGNMQAENAMRSFSNGGLFGVGPNNGEVKYHLPDAHADFIFAVAGEEFGAVFCLIILAIYMVVVLRGLYRANASADLFVILAVSGLALQFGLQAAIHMASSVHLIPTKGMTLPLISYGGSSMLASCITLGMLLALTRRQSGTGRQP